MSTQQLLQEEIKKQPEPILRELWLYLRYLARHNPEHLPADISHTRSLEREALDIMAGRELSPR